VRRSVCPACACVLNSAIQVKNCHCTLRMGCG
jgi:hypothetical protein